MYFGLFDEKHKTAMVDLDERTPSTRPSTGLYDSGVLCQTCDNEILGSLENYGRQVLYSDNNFINFFEVKGITESVGLRSAHLRVEDYNGFKLFLVSLVWKMHISKNSFFSQVDPGTLHAENIRTKILNHEKMSDSEYEVAILAIEKTPLLLTRMIPNPKKIKHGMNTYYVVLIMAYSSCSIFRLTIRWT
jgi:hypothetical protein